jgi:hypothetical protein
MFRNVQASPPPMPIKSKSKVKAGTIIPAIIIIGCLVGAFYFSGFFDGFTDSMGGTLTATRDRGTGRPQLLQNLYYHRL